MEATQSPDCQLCKQESCCPEHCCDWDTCQCKDCYQCSTNKLNEEFIQIAMPSDHKYDDPSSVVNMNASPKKSHFSVVHPEDRHD